MLFSCILQEIKSQGGRVWDRNQSLEEWKADFVREVLNNQKLKTSILDSQDTQPSNLTTPSSSTLNAAQNKTKTHSPIVFDAIFPKSLESKS